MTDLKREDVARVLAERWMDAVRQRKASLLSVAIGHFDAIRCEVESEADALNLRPEFESALKALEKEQGRG